MFPGDRLRFPNPHAVPMLPQMMSVPPYSLMTPMDFGGAPLPAPSAARLDNQPHRLPWSQPYIMPTGLHAYPLVPPPPLLLPPPLPPPLLPPPPLLQPPILPPPLLLAPPQLPPPQLPPPQLPPPQLLPPQLLPPQLPPPQLPPPQLPPPQLLLPPLLPLLSPPPPLLSPPPPPLSSPPPPPHNCNPQFFQIIPTQTPLTGPDPIQPKTSCDDHPSKPVPTSDASLVQPHPVTLPINNTAEVSRAKTHTEMTQPRVGISKCLSGQRSTARGGSKGHKNIASTSEHKRPNNSSMSIQPRVVKLQPAWTPSVWSTPVRDPPVDRTPVNQTPVLTRGQHWEFLEEREEAYRQIKQVLTEANGPVKVTDCDVLDIFMSLPEDLKHAINHQGGYKVFLREYCEIEVDDGWITLVPSDDDDESNSDDESTMEIKDNVLHTAANKRTLLSEASEYVETSVKTNTAKKLSKGSGLASTHTESLSQVLETASNPTESLTQDSELASNPIKNLTQVLRPALNPIESLTQVLRPALNPTESRTQVLRPAFNPTESLTHILRPALNPTESLTQVLRPALNPTESLTQVLRPALNPTESLTQVLRPALNPTESLTQVLRPALNPTESLTQVLRPALNPTESRTQVLQPALNPTESLTQDLQPALNPTESLTQVLRPALNPTESLAQVLRPALNPTESLTQDLQPALNPTESLTQVLRPALNPTESLTQDLQPVLNPTESLTQVLRPALNPTESLTQVLRPALNPTESLTQVLRPALNPTESLTSVSPLLICSLVPGTTSPVSITNPIGIVSPLPVTCSSRNLQGRDTSCVPVESTVSSLLPCSLCPGLDDHESPVSSFTRVADSMSDQVLLSSPEIVYCISPPSPVLLGGSLPFTSSVSESDLSLPVTVGIAIPMSAPIGNLEQMSYPLPVGSPVLVTQPVPVGSPRTLTGQVSIDSSPSVSPPDGTSYMEPIHLTMHAPDPHPTSRQSGLYSQRFISDPWLHTNTVTDSSTWDPFWPESWSAMQYNHSGPYQYQSEPYLGHCSTMQSQQHLGYLTELPSGVSNHEGASAESDDSFLAVTFLPQTVCSATMTEKIMVYRLLKEIIKNQVTVDLTDQAILKIIINLKEPLRNWIKSIGGLIPFMQQTAEMHQDQDLLRIFASARQQLQAVKEEGGTLRKCHVTSECRRDRDNDHQGLVSDGSCKKTSLPSKIITCSSKARPRTVAQHCKGTSTEVVKEADKGINTDKIQVMSRLVNAVTSTSNCSVDTDDLTVCYVDKHRQLSKTFGLLKERAAHERMRSNLKNRQNEEEMKTLKDKYNRESAKLEELSKELKSVSDNGGLLLQLQITKVQSKNYEDRLRAVQKAKQRLVQELGQKTKQLLSTELHLKKEALRKASIVKVDQSTCTIQDNLTTDQTQLLLDRRERALQKRLQVAEIQILKMEHDKNKEQVQKMIDQGEYSYHIFDMDLKISAHEKELLKIQWSQYQERATQYLHTLDDMFAQQVDMTESRNTLDRSHLAKMPEFEPFTVLCQVSATSPSDLHFIVAPPAGIPDFQLPLKETVFPNSKGLSVKVNRRHIASSSDASPVVSGSHSSSNVQKKLFETILQKPGHSNGLIPKTYERQSNRVSGHLSSVVNGSRSSSRTRKELPGRMLPELKHNDGLVPSIAVSGQKINAGHSPRFSDGVSPVVSAIHSSIHSDTELTGRMRSEARHVDLMHCVSPNCIRTRFRNGYFPKTSVYSENSEKSETQMCKQLHQVKPIPSRRSQIPAKMNFSKAVFPPRPKHQTPSGSVFNQPSIIQDPETANLEAFLASCLQLTSSLPIKEEKSSDTRSTSQPVETPLTNQRLEYDYSLTSDAMTSSVTNQETQGDMQINSQAVNTLLTNQRLGYDYRLTTSARTFVPNRKTHSEIKINSQPVETPLTNQRLGYDYSLTSSGMTSSVPNQKIQDDMKVNSQSVETPLTNQRLRYDYSLTSSGMTSSVPNQKIQDDMKVNSQSVETPLTNRRLRYDYSLTSIGMTSSVPNQKTQDDMKVNSQAVETPLTNQRLGYDYSFTSSGMTSSVPNQKTHDDMKVNSRAVETPLTNQRLGYDYSLTSSGMTSSVPNQKTQDDMKVYSQAVETPLTNQRLEYDYSLTSSGMTSSVPNKQNDYSLTTSAMTSVPNQKTSSVTIRKTLDDISLKTLSSNKQKGLNDIGKCHLQMVPAVSKKGNRKVGNQIVKSQTVDENKTVSQNSTLKQYHQQASCTRMVYEIPKERAKVSPVTLKCQRTDKDEPQHIFSVDNLAKPVPSQYHAHGVLPPPAVSEEKARQYDTVQDPDQILNVVHQYDTNVTLNADQYEINTTSETCQNLPLEVTRNIQQSKEANKKKLIGLPEKDAMQELSGVNIYNVSNDMILGDGGTSNVSVEGSFDTGIVDISSSSKTQNQSVTTDQTCTTSNATSSEVLFEDDIRLTSDDELSVKNNNQCTVKENDNLSNKTKDVDSPSEYDWNEIMMQYQLSIPLTNNPFDKETSPTNGQRNEICDHPKSMLQDKKDMCMSFSSFTASDRNNRDNHVANGHRNKTCAQSVATEQNREYLCSLFLPSFTTTKPQKDKEKKISGTETNITSNQLKTPKQDKEDPCSLFYPPLSQSSFPVNKDQHNATQRKVSYIQPKEAETNKIILCSLLSSKSQMSFPVTKDQSKKENSAHEERSKTCEALKNMEQDQEDLCSIFLPAFEAKKFDSMADGRYDASEVMVESRSVQVPDLFLPAWMK